jgi:hypothetical protein
MHSGCFGRSHLSLRHSTSSVSRRSDLLGGSRPGKSHTSVHPRFSRISSHSRPVLGALQVLKAPPCALSNGAREKPRPGDTHHDGVRRARVRGRGHDALRQSGLPRELGASSRRDPRASARGPVAVRQGMHRGRQDADHAGAAWPDGRGASLYLQRPPVAWPPPCARPPVSAPRGVPAQIDVIMTFLPPIFCARRCAASCRW